MKRGWLVLFIVLLCLVIVVSAVPDAHYGGYGGTDGGARTANNDCVGHEANTVEKVKLIPMNDWRWDGSSFTPKDGCCQDENYCIGTIFPNPEYKLPYGDTYSSGQNYFCYRPGSIVYNEHDSYCAASSTLYAPGSINQHNNVWIRCNAQTEDLPTEDMNYICWENSWRKCQKGKVFGKYLCNDDLKLEKISDEDCTSINENTPATGNMNYVCIAKVWMKCTKGKIYGNYLCNDNNEMELLSDEGCTPETIGKVTSSDQKLLCWSDYNDPNAEKAAWLKCDSSVYDDFPRRGKYYCSEDKWQWITCDKKDQCYDSACAVDQKNCLGKKCTLLDGSRVWVPVGASGLLCCNENQCSSPYRIDNQYNCINYDSVSYDNVDPGKFVCNKNNTIKSCWSGTKGNFSDGGSYLCNGTMWIKTENCTNGKDDNEDGKIDCSDPQCKDRIGAALNQNGCTNPAGCKCESPKETICNDGFDNDFFQLLNNNPLILTPVPNTNPPKSSGLGKLGDQCDENYGYGCDLGLECSDPLNLGGDYCNNGGVPGGLLKAGQSCTKGSDCNSNWCYQGKCAGKIGDQCNPSDKIYCDVGLRCDDPLDMGGSYCIGDIDDSCNQDWQCVSGVCLNGICSLKQNVGSSCQKNSDCATGLTCSNNLCGMSSNTDCFDTNCRNTGSIGPNGGRCCNSDTLGATCEADKELHEVKCNDNTDNDGDGLKDCLDPDCAEVDGCLCDDGIDNDNDTLIDCADSGCVGYFGLEGEQCQRYELSCNDGFDNNGNNFTDCADPYCWGRTSQSTCIDNDQGDIFNYSWAYGIGNDENLWITELNTVLRDTCKDRNTLKEATCDASGRPVYTEVTCPLGQDCNSGKCEQIEMVTFCGPGCVTVDGQKHEVNCNDGIDNDKDIQILSASGVDVEDNARKRVSYIDCLDEDCKYDPSCITKLDTSGYLCEEKETFCADGQDNDGDLLVDCLDPDCNNKICGGSERDLKVCYNSKCQGMAKAGNAPVSAIPEIKFTTYSDLLNFLHTGTVITVTEPSSCNLICFK